ncbi:MAG: HDOD domain-containing protein [Pirellulales bacterium]|nr:HDOD domain-containing protein [Pirellulales bacterium]
MVRRLPTLDEVAREAQQLFTLPAVALKLLELTNRADVAAAELRACLEQDPALTSKVLRVVNSSLFGLSRKVADLHQAVALLGVKPLKLLVLGFSLPDAMFAGVARDVLARYWKLTLTRALAARELMERIWRRGGDEALIVGLLADLGFLALVQCLGPPYVAFARRAWEAESDLVGLEQRALGYDHRQLTVRLLDQWGLPESIVAALRPCDPHTPPPDEVRILRSVLRLAELLAHVLCGERHRYERLVGLARQEHRLDREALAAVVQTLQQQVTQLADVLAVPIDALDYQRLWEDAHAHLTAAAAEAALSLAQAARREDDLVADFARQAATDVTQPERVGADSRAAPRPLPPAGETRTPPRPTTRTEQTAAAGAHCRAGAMADQPRSGVSVAVDEPLWLLHVRSAAQLCRTQRQPLALLLMALEPRDLPVPSEELLRLLAQLCDAQELPGAQCLRAGFNRLAWCLPDCDRPQAVALAQGLRRQFRENPLGRAAGPLGMGLAVASHIARNFDAAMLADAADRCLGAAQLSGGDCLKSIDL